MTDDALNEADLKLAEPIALVKVASALQGVTGVFIALTGVQMWGVYGYGDLAWIEYVPYFLMVIGTLQLAVATMVYRARAWAALAGAILGLFAALVMGAWDVLCVVESMFSCIGLLAFPLAGLSAILAFLAIGPVRATAAARARLSAAGMGLGL
jgi:hypothetical protein